MVKRDLNTAYWLLTAGLLAAGLTGWTAGIYLAIILTIIQVAHVLWLKREVTAFPVQVRLVYLAMLIVGLWGPLQWIHWLQLVGTSARVLTGYCLLARTLSLFPWNRQQPLSWDLLKRTYLTLRADMPACMEVFSRMSFESARG